MEWKKEIEDKAREERGERREKERTRRKEERIGKGWEERRLELEEGERAMSLTLVSSRRERKEDRELNA